MANTPEQLVRGLYPHQINLVHGSQRLDKETYVRLNLDPVFMEDKFIPFYPNNVDVFCFNNTGKVLIRQERRGKPVFSGIKQKGMTVDKVIAEERRIVCKYETEGEQRMKDVKARSQAIKIKRAWETVPTEGERQLMENETQGVLEEIGYYTAIDPDRKDADRNLSLGVGLNSRGVRDPNAQLTQVAAGMIRTERRVRRNAKILKKHRTIYQLLVDERAREIDRMSKAVKKLRKAVALPRVSHQDKVASYRETVIDLWTEISQSLDMNEVLFSPFRPAARAVIDQTQNLQDALRAFEFASPMIREWFIDVRLKNAVELLMKVVSESNQAEEEEYLKFKREQEEGRVS